MAAVTQRDRDALSEVYKYIEIGVEQEDFTAKRFASLTDIPYGQAQRLLSEWEAVGIVDRSVAFTPRVGKVSKVTFTLPLGEAIDKWQDTSHIEKSEGVGEKERILRFLADAGGKPLALDDIDLRVVDIDKHNLVHQLWSLQKERLVKFREARSNGSAGRRQRGLEDIQLTQMGWERLSETARSDKADLVLADVPVESEVPVPDVPDDKGSEVPVSDESPVNDYVGEDKPEVVPFEAEAEASVALDLDGRAGTTRKFSTLAVEPTPDYPLLADLRQREQKVAAASKLLEEASTLLAQLSADDIADRATELAIEALGLKVLSLLELEYLRYAEETEAIELG